MVMQGFDIRFPGSDPVCLDRDRLALLRENYYYLSWKADGCRYMMLIKRDGCYLINTNFEFRRVQLRFPKRNKPNDPHHVTLVDGEMVIDDANGNQVRRYLVNDLLVLNGESMASFPFSQRWSLIDKELIRPRQSDGQTNQHYDYGMEAFRMVRKDFWMLSTVRKLFADFIPKLPHRSRGLIFQCWDDSYAVQTHNRLLYWKNLHKNSLNFLYELVNEPSVYLWDGAKNRKLEGAHVNFGAGHDPWEFKGKIIKCYWKATTESWEFISVTIDKSIPDRWSTYLDLKKDIQYNIDQDELLGEIDKIVQLPMYIDKMNQEMEKVNE
jgi:mRNA-capping enzyme